MAYLATSDEKFLGTLSTDDIAQEIAQCQRKILDEEKSKKQ